AAGASGRPDPSGIHDGHDVLLRCSDPDRRHRCDVWLRCLPDAVGPWCLRRRRGWIVLALPAEVGELALELGDAPAGLPLAGQCRLEPLGQALELGPTLLGACLEPRLEARLLRPETLRQARELGRTLGGARLERCLDARLLRSFGR